MAEQEFAVSHEQHGSLPLLRVRGELDIYTAPRLKEAIAAALSPENRSLIIDLSGVGFLDSTGSQVLMIAKAHTDERGGELYIVGAQPQVRRLFHLVGLEEILHLCDEVDLPEP
jgi:anti-sigma B factor antagonist